MKGFRSARSASLLAAAYLAVHLPFLAPSLEDIDSINFALGLREFDIGSHQPHPPGYPVYIALGRLSLAVVTAAAPSLDAARAEALALSVWSAIAGAVVLVAAWMLFAALDGARRTALWATALLAVAPLFWLAGLRPMSDLPGLAIAICAQALIVGGMGDRRYLTAGAFLAGIAAGVRVQMILLTAPLLVVVLVLSRTRKHESALRNRNGWRTAHCALGLAVGVLAWAVPLVAAAGGVDGYTRALALQAGEDFAWVDMLWANPTPRRLALTLYETLVLPWSMVALAVVVGVAAVAGGVSALMHERRGLVLATVAFGPYLVFHLLFQETFTVRYALPLLPAVAWLAARGLMAAGRAGPVAAAALVAWAAMVAMPAGVAYGREAHPAFRAIADIEHQARVASSVPSSFANGAAVVFSHYSLRRPLQAHAPAGVRVAEPSTQGEWLAMVDYWLSGRTAPIWFLADPRRTDLDSIDPQAHQLTRYRWRVGGRPELTGTRPLGVDWYRFDSPGWFVGEGWSLTPETGGLTRATGTGPDRQPIEAFVRTGRGPMHVMIGGGYLETNVVSGSDGANRPGGVGEAVDFTLSIDQVPLSNWTLTSSGDGRFLQFIDLPDGVPSAAAARYATLTIAARAAVRRQPTPAVAIRQFDIQPASRLIAAFADGWHDEEYDNITGLRWRWTSDRSVIRVSPPQGVRLRLRGESPARYFDVPPRVRISADARTVAVFEPSDDFVWEVVVPAEDVVAAGGAITIETDRVYLPADAEGTDDRRRLGLRLFETGVHPVTP